MWVTRRRDHLLFRGCANLSLPLLTPLVTTPPNPLHTAHHGTYLRHLFQRTPAKRRQGPGQRLQQPGRQRQRQQQRAFPRI